jgi:nucleoside 2-deoxyribosyltransferase
VKPTQSGRFFVLGDMELESRVYLACGWLTKDQRKSLQDAREVLTKLNIPNYAAYYDGIVLEKDSPLERRGKAFRMNLGELHYCQVMVAVIDDFNPGTMWEMGHFYPKPIIAYTSVPNRGLNVMLAESVHAFANGKKELTEILSRLVELRSPTINQVKG